MVYVGSDPVFGGDVQVGGSMRGGERKGVLSFAWRV